MSLEKARWQCDECGQSFLSKLALRGHQSTHAAEVAREVADAE